MSDHSKDLIVLVRGICSVKGRIHHIEKQLDALTALQEIRNRLEESLKDLEVVALRELKKSKPILEQCFSDEQLLEIVNLLSQVFDNATGAAAE